MKKRICLLMLMTLCFVFPFYSEAAVIPPATPQWTYIDSIFGSAKVQNGIIYVNAEATASSNTITKTSITVELQQYSNSKWNKVTAWNAEVAGKVADLSKSRAVSSSYKYRIYITAKVYSGSTLKESASKYVNAS